MQRNVPLILKHNLLYGLLIFSFPSLQEFLIKFYNISYHRPITRTTKDLDNLLLFLFILELTFLTYRSLKLFCSPFLLSLLGKLINSFKYRITFIRHVNTKSSSKFNILYFILSHVLNSIILHSHYFIWYPLKLIHLILSLIFCIFKYPSRYIV